MRCSRAWVLLLLAALVRGWVAMQTAVPGRDAAHYLWMAERAAQGEVSAWFATVFHPAYSMLVSAVLWLVPELDGVAAGQWVAGSLGALAVLPLYALTKRLVDERAATAAGLFYALGVWFARHPADCLSEGPFYLVVACVAHAVLRPVVSARHGLLAGVLASLAFGLRPEGASLALVGVPWLWWRGDRAAAVAFAATFAVGVVPWVAGFSMAAGEFSLTPKLDFNYGVGVGAEGAGWSHYLGHLVQVPSELFEALGYAAVPMAIAGIWLCRPITLRSEAGFLLALVGLQLLVIPFLRSHFRFLSGYGFLWLVFAGRTWSALHPRWRTWQPALRWGVVLLAFGGDLVRLPQARRHDRIVLRELGHHLREQLESGERIATDMPRLEYYAGLEPGPPRPIAVKDILVACNDPATRYVVVVSGRTPVRAADLGSEFAPVQVPEALAPLVAERSILVFRRRP